MWFPDDEGDGEQTDTEGLPVQAAVGAGMDFLAGQHQAKLPIPRVCTTLLPIQNTQDHSEALRWASLLYVNCYQPLYFFFELALAEDG